jgi:hypothetical protein
MALVLALVAEQLGDKEDGARRHDQQRQRLQDESRCSLQHGSDSHNPLFATAQTPISYGQLKFKQMFEAER